MDSNFRCLCHAQHQRKLGEKLFLITFWHFSPFLCFSRVRALSLHSARRSYKSYRTYNFHVVTFMMKLKTFTLAQSGREREANLFYAITQQNVKITYKIIFTMAMDFCTVFFMRSMYRGIYRYNGTHSTETYSQDYVRCSSSTHNRLLCVLR